MYSADFCLSYVNDNILKDFDKVLMIGMILVDLQNAVDKIDHDVLLQILYAISFSKHTVDWFKSYLSNRSFLVNSGNNFYQSVSVSCGVPRGSILRPLLFLININGMSQAVKCHFFLYADNSCLACQHENINEIEKKINVDLSNIFDWFLDNKLSIHFGEDNTKSILFCP